jgi:hypothetical protein
MKTTSGKRDPAPPTPALAAAHERLHVRDYARTTLKPRHRPVVRAFAEALFHQAVPVPEARLDAFAGEVDRFISPASKTLRFGLLLMLDVIRWLPLLVVGRPALFEDLPLAVRITLLERLEGSRFTPLTLILVAYKTMMTVLFFEESTELAATGYPGDARERWRKGLHLLEAEDVARGVDARAAARGTRP